METWVFLFLRIMMNKETKYKIAACSVITLSNIAIGIFMFLGMSEMHKELELKRMIESQK